MRDKSNLVICALVLGFIASFSVHQTRAHPPRVDRAVHYDGHELKLRL